MFYGHTTISPSHMHRIRIIEVIPLNLLLMCGVLNMSVSYLVHPPNLVYFTVDAVYTGISAVD